MAFNIERAHVRQPIQELPAPRIYPTTLLRVGFTLSLYVLSVITLYVIFIIIFLMFRSPDESGLLITEQTNLNDSTAFNNKMQLNEIIQEERKNERDFYIQISQMVLLNLLLPTLTAILGYIFGSRQSDNGNP